jgi:hypothetical protein
MRTTVKTISRRKRETTRQNLNKKTKKLERKKEAKKKGAILLKTKIAAT